MKPVQAMKIETSDNRITKVCVIVLVVAAASTSLGFHGRAVVSEDAARATLPLILASGLLLAKLEGKTSEKKA